MSEFNNAICGISDSFVRFLHSDQNVRNAPDQAKYVFSSLIDCNPKLRFILFLERQGKNAGKKPKVLVRGRNQYVSKPANEW